MKDVKNWRVERTSSQFARDASSWGLYEDFQFFLKFHNKVSVAKNPDRWGQICIQLDHTEISKNGKVP